VRLELATFPPSLYNNNGKSTKHRNATVSRFGFYAEFSVTGMFAKFLGVSKRQSHQAKGFGHGCMNGGVQGFSPRNGVKKSAIKIYRYNNSTRHAPGFVYSRTCRETRRQSVETSVSFLCCRPPRKPNDLSSPCHTRRRPNAIFQRTVTSPSRHQSTNCSCSGALRHRQSGRAAHRL